MKFQHIVAAAAILVGSTAAHAIVAIPAPTATFGGHVAAGPFTLDLGQVTVGAGLVGDLTGGVNSAPLDVTTPYGSWHVFDALTLNSVSLGSVTDSDLSNGFSFLNLAAGTYTLSLSGTSLTGGTYGGSYTLSTSPVPEADTAMLALAGLGVAALVMRRRAR